jgi:hypothetical protein
MRLIHAQSYETHYHAPAAAPPAAPRPHHRQCHLAGLRGSRCTRAGGNCRATLMAQHRTKQICR